MTNSTSNQPRSLSVAHLVFGLIFGGIATLWFLGNANDTAFGDQAAGLPVVLIGAGIIGLVAAVVSRRQSVQRAARANVPDLPASTTETTEDTTVLDAENPTTEDTTVLTDQKDES